MSTPGEIVDGRFELLRRLGSGGMGTVWQARDTVLHREVALKEVRPPDPVLTADARAQLGERVLREARSLARLNHPHVVTIHHIVEAGERAEHPWLVMELLPGHNLQDRLGQGPLPPAEAARMGRQVLAALRAAHAAGIHHRDVKPANIMLREDGSAVLTDFGIAALQGATSLTATGDLIGSPEYIAPERIRGVDTDPASDLWSLGLVLYVAVEGVSPLRRATTLATLAAVLDDPVPPPVRSGPLAPVLSALLVRDPAARPGAERLDAMLAEVESGGQAPWAQPTQTVYVPPLPPPPTQLDSPRPTASGAPAPGPTAPSPHPGTGSRSRTPVIVSVIAVAVAVVAATAAVFALRGDTGDQAGRDKGGDRTSSPTTPAREPATPTPTATQEPTPEATEAPDPDPTTQAPPPADEVADTWVAQLASVDQSKGPGAREKAITALRAKGINDVRYIDSGDYASLRPGYWMIYRPGFHDGNAAIDWCRGQGLATNNQCVGRYVSHSAADRQYVCDPASPVARGCTRT
ncbi:serine/threonine protein kinase [Streptomyces sp. SH5]|uniref:serine/threonine-protein kinase n=1 Tax=Streptomyces sp. SH5 TaxID=3041765 RepID=UPI00247814FA|nr:serine/threonine protein kinase [Streptomyces sp. SH5]WGP08415.1 protein kinase [Streptomyces sp. SH5]